MLLLIFLFLFSSAFCFKVGFIYIGPIEDCGWSYAHELGRQYIETMITDLETEYYENIPGGEKSTEKLRELAENGCDLIFATSYDYMDSVLEVAAEYPDVIFMHCSGYKRSENVGTYFGRIYQADFLAGLVAGKMSKTNLVGYVAPVKIPEVMRGVDSFAIGVMKANNDAKVLIEWIGDWTDKEKEIKATENLIEQEVDVIAHGMDTATVNMTADEHGVWSIGYNHDMSKYAFVTHLTAPVWYWGELYLNIVENVIHKTWKSEDLWPGIETGEVELAPLNGIVTSDIRRLIEKYRIDMILNRFHVFEGPLNNQSGEIEIEKGIIPDDQYLLTIDWLVENIVDKADISERIPHIH
ncbi:MAG: BMP family ABC transporter substrate-binding protein [Kosmotogaceae bacterium]